MEKAKSPREIPLGVIPPMANFGLLAEGANVMSPIGKFPLSQKMFTFLREIQDRHIICGKMNTQKLLNVPLHAEVVLDHLAAVRLLASGETLGAFFGFILPRIQRFLSRRFLSSPGIVEITGK